MLRLCTIGHERRGSAGDARCRRCGLAGLRGGPSRRRRDRGDRRPPRVLGFTDLRKRSCSAPKARSCTSRSSARDTRALIRPGHRSRAARPTATAPTIGISPSEQPGDRRFLAPAGMEDPPRLIIDLKDKERESKVDVLVAAGPAGEEPTHLDDVLDYDRLLARYAGPADQARHRAPADLALRRRRPGARAIRADLPAEPFRRLRPPAWRSSRSAESARTLPRRKAGFRKGDRIVKVNGHDDFDPMRLPGLCLCQCRQADDLRGRARRRRPASGSTRDADRDPRRHAPPDRVCRCRTTSPSTWPASACATRSGPASSAVRPGSPAARAGLKPGDVINAHDACRRCQADRFSGQPRLLGNRTDGRSTIEFKRAVPRLVHGVRIDLQYLPIAGSRADRQQRVPADQDHARASTETGSTPARGLLFFTDCSASCPLKPGLGAAQRIRRDDREIFMVYSMFRSLAQMRVSPKQLGGPIMIAGWPTPRRARASPT